jgi:hypothetical protein
MKPREIATRFVQDHKAARGILHLIIHNRYTGRNGWQRLGSNTSTRNYYYVIADGEARQLRTRNEWQADWHRQYQENPGGPLYWPVANGICQRCGEPVLKENGLRIYYEPFADKDHPDDPAYAPLYLCGVCITKQDLDPRQYWTIQPTQKRHVNFLADTFLPRNFVTTDYTIYVDPDISIMRPDLQFVDYGPYAMAAGGAR